MCVCVFIHIYTHTHKVFPCTVRCTKRTELTNVTVVRGTLTR